MGWEGRAPPAYSWGLPVPVGHGLGWQVPHALPCVSGTAAAPGGTCTAPAPALAASKDLCGVLGEGRASLGFTPSELVPAQLSLCTSFWQCSQLPSACRGCGGSAGLASAPWGGENTRLLRSTGLLQGSRAAHTPGPAHALPRSRRRSPKLGLPTKR